MSIDLTREQPIVLADVPRLPWLRRASGRRISVATVYRWCQRGLSGHRLEYVQVGGTKMTTESALQRFFDALTVAQGQRSAIEKDRAKLRCLQRIEGELNIEGI